MPKFPTYLAAYHSISFMDDAEIATRHINGILLIVTTSDHPTSKHANFLTWLIMIGNLFIVCLETETIRLMHSGTKPFKIMHANQLGPSVMTMFGPSIRNPECKSYYMDKVVNCK